MIASDDLHMVVEALGRFVATLFDHFSQPMPEELRESGEGAELVAARDAWRGANPRRSLSDDPR